MNIKLVKFLAAVCGVLLALIIVEWVANYYARSSLLDSIGSSAAPGAADAEIPVISLKEKPEESYVDLVTRPLFIKGRKPVEESTPDQEKAAISAENLDWQLNGIYTGKKGLSALFTRTKTQSAKDQDNYRKLSQNDDLDGWKLVEIKKDRVVLALGDQNKELLLRKPKPKELPKNQSMPTNGVSPIPQVQDPKRTRPGRSPIPMPESPNRQEIENDPEAEENSNNE